MRRYWAAVVVFIGVAPVAGAFAQSAPSTPEVQLTLSEAVQQAVSRNRDLAVTRREIDVSRGRLQQARRYPFNPELAIEGEGGRGVGREDPDRRGIGGGKVGLSQVVEIRGQRGLRVRAAESDLTRTEWAVRNAEREVIAETTKAFAELMVAQERLVLSRESLSLATGLRESAKQLVDAGDAPELDLLRADVEVRRATNRLRLDEAAVGTATRTLASLTGASPEIHLTPRGPLMLDPLSGTRDELITAARVNRPDLKVAEGALESARASLRLIMAERFIPSITLSASYGEALDFDARTRLALFGVSIPLPLWNRRDGDVKAAEAEIARQEAERERVLAHIEREVSTTFAQFLAARQVVEEYVRQIVPAQEQNARLVQEGYRLGEFRLTEALLAQRDLVESRTAYLDAIANYNGVRVELEKAVGVRP